MFIPQRSLSSSSFRGAVLAASVLAFSSVSAMANPVTFLGEDLYATPGSSLPNSSAAAASFAVAAGALGPVSTITFESAPLGPYGSLTVAPGVVMSSSLGSSLVNNTPNFPSNPSLDGFNTTPGGANYVETAAGVVTFTFSTPVDAFGAYLTGLQGYYNQDTITFSDGTSETVNAPETGTSNGSTGATDFVGFTDAGASITSISITAGNGSGDFIGIDDVSYGVAASPVSATPEPSSLVLLLTGLSGLGAGYRKMRAGR